jgi:hypothetical protein
MAHASYILLAQVGLFFVFCYLVSIMLLARYLKQNHNATWTELGKPSVLNNSISNGWKLFSFTFGSKYKQLDDQSLFYYVLMVRALFAAASVIYIALLLKR